MRFFRYSLAVAKGFKPGRDTEGAISVCFMCLS